MKYRVCRKRLFILGLSLVAFIVFVKIYYLLFIDYGIVIPCFFRKITGFYCPGCGVTRMLYSLVKLNFYQAFRYNPLIFLAMPFIIFCILDRLIKWLKNRNDYFYTKINNRIWIMLVVITLLFGLLRNIPAFDYLIPTVI